MSTYKIKKLSILVCLALLPFTAQAAGLGKINVTSSLGEPFSAEIDLLSTTPDELESLVAIVASEEAYAAQGITRLGIHNNIKVEVVDAVNGGKKVKLTSSQAVTDPYVDMLIQLDWASGRLQREYTVLLDPPDYKQSIKNQDVASVPKSEPKPLLPSVQKPVVPQKSTELGDMLLEGVDAPDASETAASSTNPEDDAKLEQQQDNSQSITLSKPGPTQRKTKSGDTLSKIASSMRVEGVSLDQMLVALYEQNKSAFVGDNMNRLKVGKVIKLPSKEVLLSTKKSEASKTVQAHVANWNDYRTNLAGLASETKSAQPEQNNQSESGKIEATTPQATPSQTGGQDVVKLSAGDKDKLSKDAKKAEEAKKIAEQEDKVARDKAVAEAQERTLAVEKQIEDMQKLLELKNKAMSEMQKKAEADNVQKPAEEASQLQADSQASAEESPQQPSSQESVKQEPSQAEDVKPEPAAKPKPKPDVTVKPQEPVAEESSFINGLLQSINLPLLAGIAGIGLLASGWVYLRNKRRKDLESFERGILTSGGLRANTVFGNTTGNTSTSDTSFLTDFAQSTDGSMMDTNDVDPIAEAEVYMAYGRDAQAEEILKDAIVKEPKRYELHLKLLEMYAARKDTSAFEAIAGELYTTLGSDDPTWNKVAEMGKVLEPENPLYAAGVTAKVDDIPVATEKVISKPKNSEPETLRNLNEAVAAQGVAEVMAAENIKTGSRIESIVKHERKESAPKIDSMDGIQDDETIGVAEELKLENNNAILTFEPDQADRIKQGFESANIEDISFDSNLEVNEINQYEVEQSEMTVADLNFDLTQNAEEAVAQDVSQDSPQDANLKSFDLSSISLDLDGPVTELKLDSQSSEINSAGSKAMTTDASEVEVKLNLVAAYIDMDDKEGARELLDEVMKEGTEEQIMRAQLMLDNIN